MERFSRTLVVLCCFFLGLTVFATLSLAEEDSLQLSPKVELVNAFPHLRFSSVVALLPNPSKKDNLLYVVQLDGKVYVFPNDPISKLKDVKLFFDISDRIVNEGEMGLLGFAFHPKFPKVPYFYVNYNRDLGGQQYVTVISRFTADSRKQASTKEELVLLQIPQPFLTQKGGPLLFDREGYLLIGLGDGGGNGDPLNHGQDGQSLLGKILRIDVDRQEGGLPYSIPDSNPFVDQTSGVRPEIYALGLRNPWRCSYDKKDDNLWCADVGEASWEEVNIIQKGGNYGWSITEGPTCFKQLGCVVGSYAAPVYWYPHPDLQLPTLFNGVALIGGHVYRGKAIPELRGSYVFGDFINPKIGCLTKRDGVWRDSIVVPDVGKLLVIGFGVDSNKELFVLTYGEDQPIYRLRLASCGNGKVDKDEECDYGDKSFDSWKERCCDKQTCQRLKKSQC